MKEIERREALKRLGAFAAGIALANVPTLSGQDSTKIDQIFDRIRYDKDWPYPRSYMDSAERIWFEGNEAWVNVLPKAGKSLDIRLFASDTRNKLGMEPPIYNLTGVRDSLDMPIGEVYSPRLHYKIEYREGRGSWKSLAPHEVKTPKVSLKNGDKVKIIIKADDHVGADLRYEPTDKKWRTEWLRGDYITTMMREVLDNPNYYRSEFHKLKVVQGFTNACQSLEILKRNPDMVIDNGDTTGHDWYPLWGERDGNVQWPELQPYLNLIGQSKILWGRKRRAESGITSSIPYFQVLGNHDGEVNWFHEKQPFTQPYARADRKKYWRQPEIGKFFSIIPATRISSKEFTIPGFENKDQSYFPIKWANGDIMFLVLDVNSYLEKRPEQVTDWTLGEKQKIITKKVLDQNLCVPFKFICYHNTVGGYSLGPGTNKGAYGRGPLFRIEDFERDLELSKYDRVHNVDYDPSKVEQVWLTELAKDTNVRGFIYGHDHIFFHKVLEELTSEDKEIFAACAGSTSYAGGNLYETIWRNNRWKEFYGEAYKDSPDYFTQPGFLEMEIDKYGATIRYICSGPTYVMDGDNLPPGTKPGDVLFEHRIKV